ncbi:MAG: 2-dehydro-3-deoxy-6-phosphogalactonate aldolase [Gammaproteobacteria bacterium]
MNTRLNTFLDEMPVVAVLRYVRPEEVTDIGQALYQAGIRVIEVPLNSPDPFTSISKLKQSLGDESVVGAGTVLTTNEVDQLVDTGGEIAVSPNVDTLVIQRAVEKGLIPFPGFATATEALQAYQAGARYLKLFPASAFGGDYLKALSAVLPDDTTLMAFGGVNIGNAQDMLAAGAKAVGTGSDLYRPGDSAEAVFKTAKAITNLIREIKKT